MSSRRDRFARIAKAAFWWGLGALILAILGGYFGSALVRGVYPPYVAVEGISMEPMLHVGDLVMLQHATVHKLKKGDIIAFQTTPTVQKKYDVPAHFVHKIYKVVHESNGQLEFQTKGIHNPSPDGFLTPANMVIGEYAGNIPYAGYAVLFVQSKEGLILGGAVVVIIAIYILLGYLDERKAERQQITVDFARALGEMRDMVEDVVEAVTPAHRPHAPPSASGAAGAQHRPMAPMLLPGPGAASGAGATSHVGQPASPPAPFGASEDAESAVGTSGDRPLVDDRLDVLVGAVSEYGVHLKSHTAVMQHLAATTGRLESVTEELLRAVVKMNGSQGGEVSGAPMTSSEGMPSTGTVSEAPGATSPEVAPSEVAPSEVAPSEVAPPEVAPPEVAPSEVAASEPAHSEQAHSAHSELAPAEPAPAEAAPPEPVPATPPPEPPPVWEVQPLPTR